MRGLFLPPMATVFAVAILFSSVQPSTRATLKGGGNVAAQPPVTPANVLTGTAAYRERIALPPTAMFEAQIEDVSRVDAPAEVIAGTRIPSPGNPPIRFEIAYDPVRIRAGRSYVVRARILVGETLLFTTDSPYPVLTRGQPNTVSLMLRRASGNVTTAAANAPLEKTYWKATELLGKPVPAVTRNREAHLVLEQDGRVAGSDGCNRITGTYERSGETIKFGPLVATEMACVDTGEVERAFRETVQKTGGWKATGNELELLDAAGSRLARFEASAGR